MTRITIPRKAAYVIDTLQTAGYEAYAVGGCVRDSLLGREPQDWDVTTSARPEQVKALFRHTIDTGLKHGTVTVLHERENFEVTTYRIDGEYEDGRHPKDVTFTGSLEEDLRRRDFTINAMAYNDREGLVDLYGGEADLAAGVIRAVGEPAQRFGEDALRMLRAVRFSGQLGFVIEDNTLAAIRELALTLEKVSAERIQTEMIKLLTSDHPDYLRIAYDVGLTKIFFPEFDRAMETEQHHPHHCFTVGEHILQSMLHIRPDKVLRLTMLLHDIGKPDTLTYGEGGITHFKGHAKLSAEMSRKILRRWKLDNDTIDAVQHLVEYHDYGITHQVSAKAARKAASRIGVDYMDLYLEVRLADTLAQSNYLRQEKLEDIEEWRRQFEIIRREGQCVQLKDLAVNGRDLMEVGIARGPELGRVLQELLAYVIEDPKKNTKMALMQEAERLKS